VTLDEMRVELERLQARRAKSRDATTQAHLDERIRVLQVRIGRG